MDQSDVRLCKKYLSRQVKFVLGLVFLGIGVVALFIGTFIQNGGPIGLPVAAGSIILSVVLLSSRVSDKEFDETVERYISHRNDLRSMVAFDLKDPYTVRGKDGKIRSSKFYVVSIRSDGETWVVGIWFADLLSGTITEQQYHVCCKDVHLQKEKRKVLGVVKNCPYLVCDTFFSAVPIDLSSIENANIIEELFEHQDT